MKILVISASFFPKNSPRSFRTTELVKELSRQGHSIDVFVPRVTEVHDHFERTFACVRIYDLGLPKWKGLKFKGKLGSLISRVVNRLANLVFDLPASEYYGLTRSVLKSNSNNYDLLITIAVPHSIHWGAASFNGLSNIARVWIADCGDPFVHNINDTFKKPFYFRYFENNFLRKSDYTTIPFEDLKEYFNPRYRDKLRIIPQGFDFSDLELDSYRTDAKKRFAFSGSILLGIRDPFELISELVLNYSDYEFYIFTKQKELFKNFGRNDGIIIKDFIERKELIRFLSGMDFLVNIDTATTGNKINAIPSKLIDYTFTQRPILSYSQGNFDKNILWQFMNGDYTGQREPLNIENYDIQNVVNLFLSLAKK